MSVTGLGLVKTLAPAARVETTSRITRRENGAPDRKTQKMPFRTRRSFTRGTPRGLLGNIGPDGGPLVIGEFVAHDSKLPVWGLESRAYGQSQHGLHAASAAL